MVESFTRRRDDALALVESRTAKLRDSLASLELARQEAAAARDQAIDASRMKSQLLANMSHEIRTLLNGMMGRACSSTPRSTPSSASTPRPPGGRGRSCSNWSTTCSTSSKIEAGKLELETCEFDLVAVLEAAV